MASVGRWRVGGTLYVTLEPCVMCAGALLQGRVDRLVYGARNHLLGAHGSWIDILSTVAQQRQDEDSDMVEAELGTTAQGWQGGAPIITDKSVYQHPFHHGLQVHEPYARSMSTVVVLCSHRWMETSTCRVLCRSARECMKMRVRNCSDCSSRGGGGTGA